jgi:DNA-binding response OmpR family regulator
MGSATARVLLCTSLRLASSASAYLRAMRILLVEDDLSLGSTIQSWLQLDGYAVDWLKRGDLVESAVRTHTYQCVLLDRGLPGLDGDAVLAALRRWRNRAPVIFITALSALEDRAQGLDLGAVSKFLRPARTTNTFA